MRTRPYKCPKCKAEHYYGRLVADGDLIPACPNCGTLLVSCR